MTSTTVKIIVSSCPPDIAQDIASKLVNDKLAACVSVIPSMHSIYWWQGELQKDAEALLVIKTSSDLADRACSRLRELHPYEVPEILYFSAEGGNPDYLAWVRSVTAEASQAEDGPP